MGRASKSLHVRTASRAVTMWRSVPSASYDDEEWAASDRAARALVELGQAGPRRAGPAGENVASVTGEGRVSSDVTRQPDEKGTLRPKHWGRQQDGPDRATRRCRDRGTPAVIHGTDG